MKEHNSHPPFRSRLLLIRADAPAHGSPEPCHPTGSQSPPGRWMLGPSMMPQQEDFLAAGKLPGQEARELSEQLSYELQSSLPNAAPSQITPGKHHLAGTHNAILQALELFGFLTFLFKKSKNWQQKRTSFSLCQAAKQALLWDGDFLLSTHGLSKGDIYITLTRDMEKHSQGKQVTFLSPTRTWDHSRVSNCCL